ncbi:MAG: hypothetical protein HW421_354 [Ignavibacteria bacterium]|nr:hypothetical protein [Ignavibacteria bacterium]
MKIEERKGNLQLKNNGALEIVFIGTGTAFSKVLYNNNLIIIKGNTHILVDFGFNAPVSLNQNTGLTPMDIEAFLPTHSHADHIGGVEYLALFNRYVGTRTFNKPQLKLITTKEYQKIFWNNSIKGGLEWNEANNEGKMKLNDYFDVHLAESIPSRYRTKYKFNFEGIELEFFGTNHIPDTAKTQKKAFISYGLFIDNKVMFTGDTKFDKSLLDIYADNSELIFHDCSLEGNPVHASLDELRTLPVEWKKKMYLMHYGDEWAKYKINDFAGFAREGVRYIFD